MKSKSKIKTQTKVGLSKLKRVRGLILFLLFLLFVGFRVLSKYQEGWPSFVSEGGITNSLNFDGKFLVFGTNYSEFYILNSKNKNDVAKLDLNSGNISIKSIRKGFAYAISGASLWKIDINKKRPVWKFNADAQYLLEKAVLHKKYVFSTSKAGELYAVDTSTGNLVWNFNQGKVENLSSITDQGVIYYGGDFTVEGGYLYLASRNKNLYALDIKNGAVKWKSGVNELITTEPQIYNQYLLVTTNKGKTFAFDKKTGTVLWQDSNSSAPTSTYCSFLTFIGTGILRKSPVLIELDGNGVLASRDVKTGKKLWEKPTKASTALCPVFYKQTVVVVGNKGGLTAISLKTGEKLWENSNLGTITTKPIIVRGSGLFLKYLKNRTSILVANLEGNLSMFNIMTGRRIWEFETGAPLASPYAKKNTIFVPTMDGLIYQLNQKNGLPKVYKNQSRFSIAGFTKKLGGKELFELTLTSTATFENPWRQADFSAIFKHETGKEVFAPGFFYDTDTWKIRFVPPLKGKWDYETIWVPHGKKFTEKGTFNATTDTSDYYLRISSVNPKRLTTDGKTIFNGIGLGDTLIDFNQTGTPLDDWAVGDSLPLEYQDNVGTALKTKSDRLITLPDYISTYGPNGAGFNMFRWSLINASESLYQELKFPSVYSIHHGKVGDELAENLKDGGFHLWLTVFGFDVPYKFSQAPNERYVLERYLRYVYARYQAYVDVWEVANEVTLPRNLLSFITKIIKNLDYEKRPISTSFEEPDFEDIDIISPHWYESEDLSFSDIKTSEHINKYEKIKKPVVFGEQGNHIVNKDETSAVRMRVRSWTAFFEEGILMFWNQSDIPNRKKTGAILNANMYLGSEERSFVRILQNFTNAFPLDSKKVGYSLDSFGVRGYGLTSQEISGGYFFNYKKPGLSTSFFLKIPGPIKEISWFDPQTGKTLKTLSCTRPNCIITSPLFNIDIAFKIKN